MTLPNFLVIGVPRAATTWLHTCLADHPRVFVPSEKKEIHYFNTHRKNGLDWYEDHFPSDSGEYQAIGEVTPNYFHAASISDIASTLGEIKILLVLREPVTRAYSAYKLHRQQFAGLDFPTALSTSKYLRNHSLYADRLDQLLGEFPSEMIRVFLYDEIASSPANVVEDVYKFLEVDSAFLPPSLGQTVNRVIFPRTQTWIRRAGLGGLLDYTKTTGVGQYLKNWSRAHQARNDKLVLSADRETRQTFVDDLTRVEELLDRDLSNWKKPIQSTAAR